MIHPLNLAHSFINKQALPYRASCVISNNIKIASELLAICP